MNFLANMTVNNSWLWLHILGAGIVARLLLCFRIDKRIIITLVAAGAIIWEIAETLTGDMAAVYGTYSRWIADSIGDILGALICAIIVIY